MLSVQLSFCCSCSVFTQYLVVKRVKCSVTVPPFCSNYQNNPTSSPGFLSQRFNNLQPSCTFDVILTTAAGFLTILSPNGPFASNRFFSAKKVAIIKLRKQLLLFSSSSSLLLSFSSLFLFLLSFSFVAVDLELPGLKKPAFRRLFTQITANFVRLVFKK